MSRAIITSAFKSLSMDKNERITNVLYEFCKDKSRLIHFLSIMIHFLLVGCYSFIRAGTRGRGYC